MAHSFGGALVIFFTLLLSLDLELMVPVVEAAQHLKVKNSQSSLGVQDHDLWLPKPFLMLTNEQLKPGILGTKLLEIFYCVIIFNHGCEVLNHLFMTNAIHRPELQPLWWDH